MPTPKTPSGPSKADLIEANRRSTEEDNEAALARTENVQPTPTQAENDAAKLGFDSLDELDNKEPDGSEALSEPVAETRQAPRPAAPTSAPKE